MVAIALECQRATTLVASPTSGGVSPQSRSRFGPGARIVWIGFLAGAVYFGGAVYWVAAVVATFGGLPAPVAFLIEVLMVASQAIFPALFALLAGRAIRVYGVNGIWLAPCCWVATEWLRATIAFAFPWVLLGSSQSRVLPIVQTASVVGVYGLSWLIALVGSAAAAVTVSRRPRHLWGALATALLLASAAVGGMIRVAHGQLVHEGQPLRVGLVQGNVEELAKWDPGNQQPILQRHLDLSRRAIGLGAQLVIWPESSTPFYFEIDTAQAAPIRRLAAQTRTPFIVGSDDFERTPSGDRYYNAAMLVGADGRSHGSYRKMELVPFGEYVPLKRALFFVGPLVQAVSDFSPGSDPKVFDLGDGRRMSVAICYESVYPWISRAFAQRGSQLLAIITNDAWFGQSSAAYQHFDQGAIRAVEEGRYVVRAANTGISGAVDPYGRILAATPLFEPEALTVDVRLLTDQTLYGRLGDLAVWISLVVAAGITLGIPRVRGRSLAPESF